jgi:putative transposase
VLKEILNGLLDRGLHIGEGIFCFIYDAKGLPSAIRKVFANRALIQRCQWHKRENVVSYLPKSQHTALGRRLQKAYEKPTYEEARMALNRLKPEEKLPNESSLASLEEGIEETLTLHRLGLIPQLVISPKTAHCIESVMSLVD